MVTAPFARRFADSPIRRFVLPILLLSLHTLARADWTLTDADSSPHKNLTVNTWNPAEGFSASDASGKLISIPSRDILSLDSGRQINSAGQLEWCLTLRNGDLLIGAPVRISGQSLMYRTPELGAIAVPFKAIAAMSRNAPAGAAAAPNAAASRSAAPSGKDVVRTRGDKPGAGDTLEGIVLSIDDANVELATGPADLDKPGLTLKLANVERIAFGGAAAPRSLPRLSARCTFVSGSVLTVPLDSQQSFSWILAAINLKDPAGVARSVDADRIASIEVLGGRVLFLTELDPASEEQTGFLESTWPAQFNKNALAQPLRVGGVNYPRGIGVHTKSTLAYDLDGSYDTLTLRAALDDSATPHGQAHLYITLDGKPLWDAPVMKPGELSPPLSLPIKGGKRLELHADPTTRLDVLGRADWLDIALRRQ